MGISGYKKNNLWIHLFTIAVCWLATELGMFFVVEHSFGSPIWPPTGIALALMLWSRGNLWPSIFIGLVASQIVILPNESVFSSIFLNYPNKFFLSGTEVLQAWVAMILIRRKHLYPNSLIRFQDIIGFLLYGAVIPCLISAILGNLSFIYIGILQWDDFLISTMVWYVGNVLGVAIFTITTLALLSNRHALWRIRAKYLIVCLCITFVLVFSLFLESKDANQKNMSTQIDVRANEIFWSLEQRFKNHIDVIQNLAFTLQYQNEVTKEEFEKYTKFLLTKGRGLSAFSWNEFVTHDERASFEAKLKKVYPKSNGIFEIDAEGKSFPAKKAERYSVVSLLYPYEGNEKTLGYNLLSLPTRATIIQKALDTGRPQISESFQLLQGDIAALAFNPVSKNGEIIGFATGVINLNQVAEELFSDTNLEGFNVELLDMTNPDKPASMFKVINQPDNEVREFIGYSIFHALPNYNKTKNFMIGGRELVLNVRPTHTYIKSMLNFTAWVELVILLAAAGLFNFVLLILTGRELIVTRLVHARTVELENAVSAKSDFLANMSHELRTPLNAIIGFSEVMKNKMFGKLGNEKYDQYAQIIHGSGNHLLSIVNDILDLSKVEGSNFELQVEPVSIVSEVENSVAVMQKLAEEKNLELSLTTKIEGEDNIRMDARLFNQMVFNLLGNAIKFTNEGSIMVNLDLLDPNEDETLLIFRVQDTGIGISPENVERVFDRFEQVGATFTKNYEGTGLGLSICKKFVEAMGGTISCESRLGVGTCFYISIPVQRCEFQEELFVAE